MGAGRPTLCTPKLVEQARAYVENYFENGDKIPSLVGLCRVLKVRRETFYLWAKFEGDEDDPRIEFKDIMEEINEEQERVALNNGLDGTFNPAITKLVLHNHGYHDKQDNTLSAPGGGPVEAQFNFIPVGPDNETD